MAKNLVIVESPAKAKTINKYLGKDFVVKASMGHVRDLPKKTLGVDVDRGFAAHYEALPTRKKILDELKAAAKEAEAIYLAADPDREGEAICWHLAQELPKKAQGRVKRVVFNEITKRAIEDAFKQPKQVDEKKVDAQQARRILDRLVGYKVSPLLWDKVKRGLSAGRVQSVALKVICEREREIREFKAEEYWTASALFSAAQPPQFPANVAKKDGKNLAISTKEQADAARAELEKSAFKVTKVTARERKRNPVPPFITSKLQQEAFKKLRFTVKKTMQVAQRLYEGIDLGSEGSVGLITYMRTDSTRVSDDALRDVRNHIATAYGGEYLPDKPVLYRTKQDAQDAHEAIRPTYLDRDPQSLKAYLGKDELALYTLIWNRFVASQMKPAVFDETLVEITAGAYLLRAKGSTLKFKGFLAVYEETPDEKREEKPTDAAPEEEAAPGTQLPPLAEGDVLKLEKLDTDQHFTQPPPRYSEASLVKELEENGIGRPSTYASIISTIETRDYIEKREGKLYPTELGFVVTDMLVAAFADIVNVDYTAAMEQELDAIEEGRDNLLNTLGQFWKKFERDLEKAGVSMPQVKGKEEATDEVCDKCGSPMVKKFGRFGSFLACSNYPECKNTKQIVGEGADGVPDMDEELTKQVCTTDGAPMVLKKGRFGYYLACQNYPECKTTKRVVRGAEGKLTLEVLKPVGEKCPECSNDLVWKRGRFGPFIGCGNCKYIKRKEAIEIGMVCPECHEGQVVERKGRGGRPFYGCKRYPKCTFTANAKPIAQPCPECGKSYLLEKETKKEGKVVFCSNESCNYKHEAA